MKKILLFLFVALVISGCQQSGKIWEVLNITDRSPVLDSGGAGATQTLVATFNFSIDNSNITKDNFFSEYAGFGPDHTAGNPTVTSLTWTPDAKTLKIEVSQWSALPAGAMSATSLAGKRVDIIPREGKIKDVFGNALQTITPLWRYDLLKYAISISGTVYFAGTTLPMENGPEVYYTDVNDPATVLGSVAASVVDGSYTIGNVETGDYFVGIEGVDGWSSTREAVNVPNLNSDITHHVNIFPDSFDVLRVGSETLNAVSSYGATRYVAGEGSALLLRSADDITWTNLPLDGTFTNDPLIWVAAGATEVRVITNRALIYSSETPEAVAQWKLEPGGGYTEEAVVDFLAFDVFYIVTESGKLMQTFGGSPTVWTDITPPGQHINAVERAQPVSTYEVLIVGDNGYVAQLDYNGNLVLDLRGDLNSNENLQAVASNIGNVPVSIYAVVAESGSVYKSEDSGSTWQTVLANAPCEFNDLWMYVRILPGQDFRDLGMYIVGNNGLIMRKHR